MLTHAARHLARVLIVTLLPLLGASAGQDAPRLTDLTVDPLAGDEGSTFAFRATIDNPTGSLVNHRWDFGDGTVIESIVDVSVYRHRYRDDGEYTATLEVDLAGGASARRSVRVSVHNVAPRITQVTRSHDPLAGAAVTFAATVVDPGDDRLTFTWDFGDGTPPVVRRDRRDLSHTYETDGAYRLGLTVVDGDGGEDTYEETVFVGTGLTFEASGAAFGSQGEADVPVLAGVPLIHDGDRLRFRGDLAAALRGDAAAVGAGPCLVVVSNRGLSITSGFTPGLILHLSAAFPAGLTEGRYPIAAERNELPVPRFAPYERQLAAPGVFFASLTDVRLAADDAPSGTGFHGTGGAVVVQRFDGDRVEMVFDIQLEEHLTVLDLIDTPAGPVFPPARTVQVRGRFVHDVARGLLERTGSIEPLTGGGFGDWYLCGSDEPLEVLTVDFGDAAGATPAAHAPEPENMPWERDLYVSGDAKLEFTVDRPLLRSSLTDRTVFVDVYQTTYAGSEPFMPVPGTVEVVDERTFRFVPDTDLRPGVHYLVKLEGGRDGARGAAGETLPEDLEWRFSTRVELASVSAHLYQVARNVLLVPGKSTMTRVYALWPEYSDLPSESQVDRFRADVHVLVDGVAVYAPERDVEIVRHDRLHQADLDAARDSVNFFGWVPSQEGGTSTLLAIVEPSDQPQPEPVRFETAPRNVRHGTESPILTVSYFFVRTGSWQDGVPAAEKARWHDAMQRGIVYAEQLFPVIEARARYAGEVLLPPAPAETVEIEDDGKLYRHYVTPDGTVRSDSWTADLLGAATRGHGADFVVGIVPHEVQPAVNGTMHYQGRAPHFTLDIAGPRTILLMSNAPLTTLAHELAHGYGLCHVFDDITDPMCPATEGAYEMDGFRIDRGGRGGAVKWLTFVGGGSNQANGDGGLLLSLMEEASAGATGDPKRTFVTNADYHRLIANVPLRERRAARPPSIPSFADDVLYASGSPASLLAVTGAVTADGRIALGRVQLLAAAEAEPPRTGEDGPFLAQLLDADGRVLAQQRFDAIRPHVSHGPNDVGPLLFDLLLPAASQARRLVISRDGRVLVERHRSAHPPTAHLELRDHELWWRASDADGDQLTVDLAYAPDGFDWMPLAIGLRTDTFTLPDDLEPGPLPSVRVRVSDGFDLAEETLRLPIDPPLRVLATAPAEGEALARDAALAVFLNGPVSEGSLLERAIVVTTDEGEAVPVRVVAIAAGRALLATPAASLAPGTYRATLSGVSSTHGAALEAPVGWTFTVAATEAGAPPSATAGNDPGAGPLPDPCGDVPREVVLQLLPADTTPVGEAEGDGCRVAARLRGSVEEARRALELALVRGRYRPTRNAQERDAVVIGFQDAAYVGEARIEPDGGVTLLTLQLRPR